MRAQHKIFRFSDYEIKKLKQLAKLNGMNESEYIKNKLFVQNPDLIEGNETYISPEQNKQGYFFAFSLIKQNLVMQEFLSKNGVMTHKEYDAFCKQETPKIREILSSLGFKKIEKDDE